MRKEGDRTPHSNVTTGASDHVSAPAVALSAPSRRSKRVDPSERERRRPILDISPLLHALLAFPLIVVAAFAQGPVDTARTLPPADTSSIGDTVIVKSESGLDELVIYSARDSVISELDRKKVYLYGNASVTKGADKLQAAYIEIDFNTQEMFAEAWVDSATGDPIGVPVLDYAGEQISALRLRYNFKTGRGVSNALETQIGEGFFRADTMKYASRTVAFAKNVTYTTCDAPHPHYFFTSPRMKLITGDRLFLDQAQVHIADVPVFWLPIGAFFAYNAGRHSGIILPRPATYQDFGVGLEDLGYFWAINDYLDTRFSTDFFSKGTFSVNNLTRYRLRGVVERLDLDLTYTRSRRDPDEEFQTSWLAGADLNLKLGRRSNLTADLNFSSKNDPIRRSTTERNQFEQLDDVTKQDITSDGSYTTSFDVFGLRNVLFTASYSRRDNIVTGELLNETPSVRLNLPTLTPFARSGPGVLQTFSLGFNTEIGIERVKKDTLPGGGFATKQLRRGMSISPTISLSPKLSNFTFQPSFSPRLSLFTRRIVKQPNGIGELDTTYVDGFYPVFSWSAGASVNTTLYGFAPRFLIAPFRFTGMTALRHRMQPAIGFSYQPDFSDPRYGYYDEFFNPRTNRIEEYYVHQADAGVALTHTPPSGKQLRTSFGLSNLFEAKIAQGDTLPDSKVTLLQLDLNTSYNFSESDSTPWSPISIRASTDLGRVGSIDGNADLSWYDADSTGADIPGTFFSGGRNLFRLNNASVTLRTRFDDRGFNDNRFLTSPTDTSITQRRGRFDFEDVPFNQGDYFGEGIRGNRSFRIPWEISMWATYSIRQIFDTVASYRTEFDLGTSFSFSLTPTTRIVAGATFDLEEGRINIPTIDLQKDLHCWEMQIRWYPAGVSNGVYFRIGLKSDVLSAIQYDTTR